MSEQPVVLLVNYDFPPMGGSGVQRALKLAKYLPRSGWRPVILCCGHGRSALRDESLLGDIPAEARVMRVNGYEPAGILRSVFDALRGDRRHERLEERLVWRMQPATACLPESALLWAAAAAGAALRLARSCPLAAIITSGPPHCAHWVGRIVRQRSGVPWVADLRDPITTNFAYAPRHRLEHAYWTALERDVAARADRLVVTSADFADDLRTRHADRLRRAGGTDPIEVITNGFDPDDFAALPRHRTAAAPFTLTYVGAFYRQQSIEPVLCGVRRLLAARPELNGRFIFEHVGSLSAAQRRFVHPGDGRFYRPLGYRPHHEALGRLVAADALLLVSPSNAGGRLCIPAKTFEYLASERPIVAIAQPGTSLSALLSSAGATVLPNDRPALLAETLASLYDRRRTRPLPPAATTELLRATRRDVLASRYADLLNDLTGQPPRLRLVGADSRTDEAAA